MTVEQVSSVVFVAISGLSLLVQAWALRRVTSMPSSVLRATLRRTACSRTACAVLYVAVGTNALIMRWHVLAIAFATFCITQGTWQANACLDARAHRRKVNQ